MRISGVFTLHPILRWYLLLKISSNFPFMSCIYRISQIKDFCEQNECSKKLKTGSQQNVLKPWWKKSSGYSFIEFLNIMSQLHKVYAIRTYHLSKKKLEWHSFAAQKRAAFLFLWSRPKWLLFLLSTRKLAQCIIIFPVFK